MPHENTHPSITSHAHHSSPCRIMINATTTIVGSPATSLSTRAPHSLSGEVYHHHHHHTFPLIYPLISTSTTNRKSNGNPSSTSAYDLPSELWLRIFQFATAAPEIWTIDVGDPFDNSLPGPSLPTSCLFFMITSHSLLLAFWLYYAMNRTNPGLRPHLRTIQDRSLHPH